ncbi:MAG: alpha/beta hydrolase [Aliishimia sp.]
MAKRLLFLFLISLIGVAAIQLIAGMREKAADASYPADGDLIEVDGVKVHVDVFGQGPDLVLIHGASGNMREFTFSMVEKLSDRYRVILIDRPGLGWSKQPEGYGALWETAGESPRVQARLMQAAADEVGISDPLVFGHSFGGAVAMAWAQEFPDTAGLIMVSAVSHEWPGELNWLHRWNASLLGGALFVPLVSAFVPKWYVEQTVGEIFAPVSPPEGYMEHVGPGLTLRRSAQRANSRQVISLRPHIVEMQKTYPDLNLPIEIIHGDADTIVPLDVHSVPLSQRVKTANLVVLEGVGHMPQHEAEADVIKAIDRAAVRAGLR